MLSAKGAMYDEVAATVDRLTKRAAEAEKEAAGAVSETKILRQEKHTLVVADGVPQASVRALDAGQGVPLARG